MGKCRGEMAGRRTAATGVWLPPGGHCPCGMRPPFSFWSCPKRECAAPGGREKGARRAPVQWPSARDGGRRIGASADLALPSGTLGSSANLQLPSRGGWCGGRRGARTHLNCSSFRAFRFATRCLGSRRGRCPHRPVAEATLTTGPAAAESSAGCIPDLPGPTVTPRAARFRP